MTWRGCFAEDHDELVSCSTCVYDVHLTWFGYHWKARKLVIRLALVLNDINDEHTVFLSRQYSFGCFLTAAGLSSRKFLRYVLKFVGVCTCSVCANTFGAEEICGAFIKWFDDRVAWLVISGMCLCLGVVICGHGAFQLYIDPGWSCVYCFFPWLFFFF